MHIVNVCVSIDSLITMFSDQGRCSLEHMRTGGGVNQLDVLMTDVLLYNFLNLSVVESSRQLSDCPFAFQEFAKLVLHQIQDLTDLSVCNLSSQLNLVAAFAIGGGCVACLVLSNILCHHLVVEAKWVTACQFVVELATLGFDKE